MDTGQRSNTRFEELDAPVAEVVLVKGRVSRLARVRPATILVSDGGPLDTTSPILTEAPDMIQSLDSMEPIDSMIRASWVVVTAVVFFIVVFIVALVMGDHGPWIVVVPGLTALCGAWLDRRIPFSFAEGFIGYRGDPEPSRGVLEEDWPAARQRSAPAAP
jgi:hypothetical protein